MTAQPLSIPITPPAPRFPPVNSPGGAILKPLPDYMGQASARFREHYLDGLTMQAIAGLYDVAPADVYKLLNGVGPDYSPRIVDSVIGIHTQEVRLVVRLAPDAEPLPKIVYLDLRGGADAIPTSPGYTLQEVADMAGCTRRTVQRYVAMGAIPIVELVPGQPQSHRVARVPAREAEAWAGWYRAKEVERRAG